MITANNLGRAVAGSTAGRPHPGPTHYTLCRYRPWTRGRWGKELPTRSGV